MLLLLLVLRYAVKFLFKENRRSSAGRNVSLGTYEHVRQRNTAALVGAVLME